MSDLRVVYVKIIDVDGKGHEITGPLYTWCLYDDYGLAYGLSYSTIEEVVTEVNRGNVIRFLKKKHPVFYKRALEEDGQFVFQLEAIPFSKRSITLARRDREDDK